MSTVTYHDTEQGSDEWFELRCGCLTASTVHQLVTPTLKVSANDKSRALANKVAVQRVSQIPEESVTTERMLRGHIDEDIARTIYGQKRDPVREVGFITNKKYPNFGYSPDGLVGQDGLIEVKSRDPHLQFSTILSSDVPNQYMAQIQTGLLISEREWCDFISFSHGLPMMMARVWPDHEWQEAIKRAYHDFEITVSKMITNYQDIVSDTQAFIPTERVNYEGMML